MHERKTCARCGELVIPSYVREHDGCVHCEGRKNRELSDRLSEAIRQVKASPPQGAKAEADESKRLAALGHPDAERCIKAICHPPEPQYQQRRRPS